MATLAPASRTSSACFPVVIPPVANITFLFSGTSAVVGGDDVEEGKDEDESGDGDGDAKSAGVGGSWSKCVDDDSAGEASELAVSEVKGLLRAGIRIRGWDLEDSSASGVWGLRVAASRATVMSILAAMSAVVSGACCVDRS